VTAAADECPDKQQPHVTVGDKVLCLEPATGKTETSGGQPSAEPSPTA
jgi:hypothetical protein